MDITTVYNFGIKKTSFLRNYNMQIEIQEAKIYNQLLDEIINNYFINFLYSPIKLAILEINGNIKFCNHTLSTTEFNCINEPIINKHFTFIIQNLENKSEQVIQQLNDIYNKVVNHGESRNFVMVKEFASNKLTLQNSFLYSFIPILTRDKQIIGAQLIINFIPNIPIENLIYGKPVTYEISTIHSFGLTEKQHAVLFLLCNKFTQEEIADYFKIARGTISRIIGDQLSIKLDLQITNTYAVISKAKKLGFQYIIPNNLISNIIIDF
jgi:hypothetical protein